MKIKIEVDLPVAYYSVLKYCAAEVSMKTEKKYSLNDLVKDLIIQYVNSREVFKRALLKNGKVPDNRFEV